MNASHSLSSQNTTPPRNPLVGRSPQRLSEKRWLGSLKKGQPSPKRKTQFSSPVAFYKATKPGTFGNNRKEKAQKWLSLSKYCPVPQYPVPLPYSFFDERISSSQGSHPECADARTRTRVQRHEARRPACIRAGCVFKNPEVLQLERCIG